MRQLIFFLAVFVVLAVPVAALADGTIPSPTSLASSTCKQEQTGSGAATFKQTYGTNASKSNAFGKCVSKNTAGARQELANAAQTCKAQQADPNFAASHGGKTFTQFYGTNKGAPSGKGAGSNAFGKCVSALAKQAASVQSAATVAAAATCKAAWKADATAFSSKWGSKPNAFGKCVAATAKTK
jgi:hypothetical protein